MLEVIGIDELATTPTIGGDEYVPLMVEWGLVPVVTWRALGPDGGICCSFDIERVSGVIVGVTILNPPAIRKADEGDRTEALELSGVPVVSREPFDLNPDLTPQQDIIDFHCSTTGFRSRGEIELRFTDEEPHRWAKCGDVGFGISSDNRLSRFRVVEAAVPSSSSLLK